MPRFARLLAPGTFTHVISRIVNREFRISGRAERAAYLERVPQAFSRTDWKVMAFALMSNHVHLGAEAGRDPSWRFTRSLNTGYAAWLNKRQERLGPVFASRPATIHFDPEEAMKLISYIHNNPVRAGLVDDPADTSWTSHRLFIGEARPPDWFDVPRALSLLGFESSSSGRLGFHEFVRAHANDPRDPEFSGLGLQRDRVQFRSLAGAPVEMTSPLQHQAGEPLVTGILALPGTPLRPRWDGDPQLVAAIVSSWLSVPMGIMKSRNRKRSVARARRIVLMAAHRFLGRSLVEAAATVGLTLSAASRLLATASVEDAELGAAVASEMWGETRVLTRG